MSQNKNSQYKKTSAKSVTEVLSALQEAVAQHGFGILHQYDFKSTLESKGHPIEPECHVLEICSPRLASNILQQDIGVAMALPCRISVYDDHGTTTVGTILPTTMLSLVTDRAELTEAAKEVEATLESIIDQSV